MIYQIHDRARGAALAPLSNEQKQKLAAMARYAWIEIGPDQDFDDWRHEEVMREVKKPGLRSCCNEDYNPLKARWLYVCGHANAAFRAAMKHATEPRSWAMFSLFKEVKEAQDVFPTALEYARGFIFKQTNLSLEHAADNMVWRACYAVRNKALSLRRARKAAAPAKAIGYSSVGKTVATRRARAVKGPF